MPALSLTVTPGTTFTDTAAIVAADLNLAANPAVELEEASIQPEHIDTDALVAEIGDSLRAENYCPWGTFHEEQFVISGTVSAVAGTRTPVHPGWYVLPAGAAVNVAASARSASSESNESGRCGLKVFGDSSLTSVAAGTYLPPSLAQMLYSGNMTFSAYVYNGTGTTFTPALEIYTGATAGDEGNVSLVSTVSASGSCASGQWTRVEFDFDASAVTNFAKGAHLRVKVTKDTGILDSGSDYFIVADAQIDAGVTAATTLKRNPLVLDSLPAGVILPYAGAYNAVPPQHLLCDGSAVSRSRYNRLFARVGTSYGAGDGSTTFNVPDLRGRIPVGAEIAGSSQSRAEVAVSVTSSSSTLLTVASGATAQLRLGMGAYGNANLATDSYITGLTDTTIELSSAPSASVSGTVYFSKLGAANAQTLGAAGAGLNGKRYQFSYTVKNCSISGTTLTLPGSSWLTGRIIACGMEISGTGVTAGTTVEAFLTGTTLKMSASGSTASGLDITFTVKDVEGQAWQRYQYLLGNPVVQFTIGTAADSSLEDVGTTDWSGIIFTGAAVSCSDGAAGIQAGTRVTGFSSNDLQITPATSGATPANYNLQITQTGLTRETTPQVAPTPGFQTVNYIIKA